MLTAGFFGSSLKANENRVPLFPEHLSWLSEDVCRSLIFEQGYGQRFRLPDEFFMSFGCQVLPRKDVFEACDIVVLPKPVASDLMQMRKGQILWGWPHCVQQRAITQAAIDREITVVAWEAMYAWGASGERLMHIFYKNNELAGYCAVHHVLQLRGIDGMYGPRRSVVLLGYGSVARGAIHALRSRGFNNILVLTQRPSHLVGDQHPDVYFSSLVRRGGQLFSRGSDGVEEPLTSIFSRADVICNCVLQDPINPLNFLNVDEVGVLKKGSTIVDISCDEGMGFPFARPTSFDAPIFYVGNDVAYYSVDHTPTYLWSSASREISKAIVPYLGLMMRGEEGWEGCPELLRAVEVSKGRVVNAKILEFQSRSSEYPHKYNAKGGA